MRKICSKFVSEGRRNLLRDQWIPGFQRHRNIFSVSLQSRSGHGRLSYPPEVKQPSKGTVMGGTVEVQAVSMLCLKNIPEKGIQGDFQPCRQKFVERSYYIFFVSTDIFNIFILRNLVSLLFLQTLCIYAHIYNICCILELRFYGCTVKITGV